MPAARIVLTAVVVAHAGLAAAQETTAHHRLHHVPHHHAAGTQRHVPHHGATRRREAARHAGSHAPAAAAAAVVAVPAKPVPPPPPPVGSVTGLPLPRFASLRSDEVNLRNGPGTRYPIQWVYKRRDLPVEIEREYDVWRLVKLQDGTEGWVHQATLVGDRTFVAVAPPAATSTSTSTSSAASSGDLAKAQTLRAAAAANAAPLAYLEPGAIGRISSCPAASDWCRVQVKGVSGFLPRAAMWGLLPDEVVATH